MAQEQEFNLKKCIVNSNQELAQELTIPDEEFGAWGKKIWDAWDEIMKYWLDGKCSEYSVTWEDLGKLLKAVDKANVAEELEKAIAGIAEGETVVVIWPYHQSAGFHLVKGTGESFLP